MGTGLKNERGDMKKIISILVIIAFLYVSFTRETLGERLETKVKPYILES